MQADERRIKMAEQEVASFLQGSKVSGTQWGWLYLP
jgi:hypothetical protein